MDMLVYNIEFLAPITGSTRCTQYVNWQKKPLCYVNTTKKKRRLICVFLEIQLLQTECKYKTANIHSYSVLDPILFVYTFIYVCSMTLGKIYCINISLPIYLIFVLFYNPDFKRKTIILNLIDGSVYKKYISISR